MVGAGIIGAFETAVFGKWVDAKLANTDVSNEVAATVALVGLISTILFAGAWVYARVVMNIPLPQNERLSWWISGIFIFIYVVFAVGWFASLFY